MFALTNEYYFYMLSKFVNNNRNRLNITVFLRISELYINEMISYSLEYNNIMH